MVLEAHNAHLISVDAPPIPADPGLGIVGGPGANRWSGDAQAYIDEDTTERVVGNQRVVVIEPVIDLPGNLPYVPQANDVLTLRWSFGVRASQVDTFRVRMIDGGLLFTGKLRVRCRAD